MVMIDETYIEHKLNHESSLFVFFYIFLLRRQNIWFGRSAALDGSMGGAGIHV